VVLNGNVFAFFSARFQADIARYPIGKQADVVYLFCFQSLNQPVYSLIGKFFNVDQLLVLEELDQLAAKDFIFFRCTSPVGIQRSKKLGKFLSRQLIHPCTRPSIFPDYLQRNFVPAAVSSAKVRV